MTINCSTKINSYLISYANFINQEYLERNYYDYLNKNIPVDYADFILDKANKVYIYIDRVWTYKSLYINALSVNDSIIELITCLTTFDL